MVPTTPLTRPTAVEKPQSATEVDERVQHLGGVGPDRAVLQVDLLESDRQHVAEPEHQQKQDHRQQPGQGDVHDPLPAVRAIDGGALVQLGRDRRQRGEEDDRAPAGVLPDHLRGDQQLERVRVAHDVHAVHPDLSEQVGHHAGAAEDLLPDRDHDHPGDEVRQVDDRLHPALHRRRDQRVQQQRQRDRRREREQDLQQRQLQRVHHRVRDIRVRQQPGEVVEPDPGAAAEAEERRVVLEGGDVADHRDVREDHEEDQSGQHEQIHPPVLPGPNHAVCSLSSAPDAHRVRRPGAPAIDPTRPLGGTAGQV
jgi:hypothetical protein